MKWPIWFGNPICLPGAYEPIVWKSILQRVKKSEKILACTSWHSMFAHKFSAKKKTFYVSRVKKDNFDAPTWLFMWHLFCFSQTTQNVLFLENLCANIECPDVHAKFCFGFFWHLFCMHFFIHVHMHVGAKIPPQNTFKNYLKAHWAYLFN
jgi:hypothetical protein